MSLSHGGSKFGLERLERALARLGHPERAMPMVHVAGSNGKGSTSAFTAHILSATGRRVGLFTSPHLISLTERIQFVEGGRSASISQPGLLEAAAEVEHALPGFEDLSFFEVMTAIGLVAFRQRGVDIAVIEAGIGARLDSTRLVEAQVAVLTDLSLEHTEILGDSIEAIAYEEGSVVRPERPLVAANASAPAMKVVEGLAEEAGAELLCIGRELDLRAAADGSFTLCIPGLEISEVRPSLLGAHQGRNAVLAAAAARAMVPEVSADQIRDGIAATVWPGRMEVFSSSEGPDVLLDGAQNAHASRVFARALAHPRFTAPRHFVFGALGDKDAGAMLQALAPRAASFCFTRPGSMRAREPSELVRLLGETVDFSGPVDAAEGPADALARASARARLDGGLVVVCGSLYLVGDIRAILVGAGS